jgi:hypothetical protein
MYLNWYTRSMRLFGADGRPQESGAICEDG